MANERTFNFIFDSVMKYVDMALNGQAPGAKLLAELQRHKVPICKVYSATRTSIKHAYMYDPGRPLDRHKCTAAFMMAVLEALPIPESKLNKEYLAIGIGMTILKIFIFQECKNSADLGFIDFLDRQNGLAFPKCDCDIEPYEYNWALGIHYDREKEIGKNVRILSPLSLSNILFLIEKYNRLLAEAEK